MKILTQDELNKLDGLDLLRLLRVSFQVNILSKKNEREFIKIYQRLITKTLQNNFPNLHKKEGLKQIRGEMK